ncbi:hypothetical protein D3C81_1591910 [compost metagenome]
MPAILATWVDSPVAKAKAEDAAAGAAKGPTMGIAAVEVKALRAAEIACAAANWISIFNAVAAKLAARSSKDNLPVVTNP